VRLGEWQLDHCRHPHARHREAVRAAPRFGSASIIDTWPRFAFAFFSCFLTFVLSCFARKKKRVGVYIKGKKPSSLRIMGAATAIPVQTSAVVSNPRQQVKGDNHAGRPCLCAARLLQKA
jgi:hypothetical protein